ncbi:hypothetical protein Aple_034150 [Acrocarpospora pleiomorpha]|uniref:Uncharacterized protein n=1 Tax=Acrocarpospora pleiomorpha TaxID=90975 RepID=A0A5M3XK63_9ACTN|nr:hypothetical protein [Acrocarpospora pleiomorpha]GES20519.1 hypothetical protein Aple_034150 [Acrocarpospora pleiomorpha]
MTIDLAAYRNDVAALKGDAPGLEDRVLLEVANRFGVIRDLNAHSTAESLPRRILSALVGEDRERQIRSIGLLNDNQEALVEWVTGIADQAAVTAFCLERVARHLAHVRATAEAAHANSLQALGEVRELAGIVSRIAAECERRLRDLENDLAHLRRRVDARHELDLVLSRWTLTDRELPWLCRLVLLARSLAAGPCGHAERVDGDRTARDILAARVVERRQPANGPRLASIHVHLDEMIARLGTPQRCEIAAWLLESTVPEPLALRRGPLTATIVFAAELAALPARSRPPEPGRTAVALSQQKYGAPPHAISLADLVIGLIDEQFDAAAESARG